MLADLASPLIIACCGNCCLFQTFRVDQQMLRCELDPLDSLPHREQARPVWIVMASISFGAHRHKDRSAAEIDWGQAVRQLSPPYPQNIYIPNIANTKFFPRKGLMMQKSDRSATKVLIVDDHPVVLSGCRSLFASDNTVKIEEATDAKSGHRAYLATKPHVAVVDTSFRTFPASRTDASHSKRRSGGADHHVQHE